MDAAHVALLIGSEVGVGRQQWPAYHLRNARGQSPQERQHRRILECIDLNRRLAEQGPASAKALQGASGSLKIALHHTVKGEQHLWRKKGR
jgi:hypothetical protein